MRFPTTASSDTEAERLFRHAQQLLHDGIDGADRNGDSVVADETVVFDDDVERDDVTVAQDPPERRDAMNDLLVDRDAGLCAG